jgi:hypothetical protein
VERALRQELASRNDAYLNSLSLLQEAVNVLRKDVLSNKERYREISNQSQLLKNFCYQLFSKVIS